MAADGEKTESSRVPCPCCGGRKPADARICFDCFRIVPLTVKFNLTRQNPRGSIEAAVSIVRQVIADRRAAQSGSLFGC
jgi:hypothetical protein